MVALAPGGDDVTVENILLSLPQEVILHIRKQEYDNTTNKERGLTRYRQ
jgi:hypothetical protein